MTKTKRRVRGFVLLLLGLALGLAAGLYMAMFVSASAMKGEEKDNIQVIDAKIEEEKFTLTVEHVREVVMPAAELTTTKYYYTDADIYENYKEAFGIKIPFTTDEVVFTYDGVISVGIDLSSVSYEIDNDAKLISVKLPELRIMANEIDASSFEYPYIFDSVFNDTNMGDYTHLIDQLKQQKEQEIMANDRFLQQARDNTRTVIARFLTAAELTKDYTVEFR